ncbi:hypothetical protein [Candidatus Spongiihabitans sp.]
MDGGGRATQDAKADGGSANNVGNNYVPTATDGGSVDTVWNE